MSLVAIETEIKNYKRDKNEYDQLLTLNTCFVFFNFFTIFKMVKKMLKDYCYHGNQ